MDNELETFEDDQVLPEPESKKRPTFITVLAILSWIYVGFGVLSGVFSSLTSSESQIETIDDSIAIYEEMDPDVMPMADDMVQFLEASKENMKMNSFGQLLMLLIEGFGVFMMFNLKKSGFWIYTLAQVGILGLTAFLFPLDNIVTIIALVMNGIIILLFEILYAVNLKHMH